MQNDCKPFWTGVVSFTCSTLSLAHWYNIDAYNISPDIVDPCDLSLSGRTRICEARQLCVFYNIMLLSSPSVAPNPAFPPPKQFL